jgi:hypothetical protein
MNWFFNLFKKKEVVTPPLLAFTVDVNKNANSSLTDLEHTIDLNIGNQEGFKDFLRNSQYKLDVADYSDTEVAHLFMYNYCQKWLADNLAKPIFVETHGFPIHGEIRYDRVWNSAFIGTVTQMGFDVLPSTEEELVDMYMNYIYGTRLIEEMEAIEAANPQSVAHPELTDPNNRLKG